MLAHLGQFQLNFDVSREGEAMPFLKAGLYGRALCVIKMGMLAIAIVQLPGCHHTTLSQLVTRF